MKTKKKRNPQGPVFYVAEERAWAPGIADGWPQIIPAPHSRNGRLNKLDYQTGHRFGNILDRKDISDRLLQQLANIPVNWDHTGHKSRAMLVAHGPDLAKVGRLIVRARLHLERTGLRKPKT